MTQKYKIVSLAGSDVGGWGVIMKKYMERLGHEFVNIVFEDSYIHYSQKEKDSHIVAKMSIEEIQKVPDLYADADFFVLRWLVDDVINALGIKKYLNKNNFIYKVHGTETRTYNMPWSLELWKFHSHGTVSGFLETPLWQNLPAPSYYHIERPCDFERLPKTTAPVDPPMLFHSPTHRMKKGTFYLEKALKELYDEGCKINFVIEEGAPYDTIQETRRTASLVFDQLGYTGTYGQCAVESWSLGIPVIIETAPIIKSFHPEIIDCGVHATVDTLKDVLRDWYENPDIYKKQGKLGKKFVKQFHDPVRIAKQYIALFEDCMYGFQPSIEGAPLLGGTKDT